MFEISTTVTCCEDCPECRASENNPGYYFCILTGKVIDNIYQIDKTCPQDER